MDTISIYLLNKVLPFGSQWGWDRAIVVALVRSLAQAQEVKLWGVWLLICLQSQCTQHKLPSFLLLQANYHRFSLTQIHPLSFYGVGVGERLTDHLVKLQVSEAPHDLIWSLGLSSMLTGCWQTLVPCDCRTEVPALYSCWLLFPAPRRHPIS
jgi:hypothetical protein